MSKGSENRCSAQARTREGEAHEQRYKHGSGHTDLADECLECEVPERERDVIARLEDEARALRATLESERAWFLRERKSFTRNISALAKQVRDLKHEIYVLRQSDGGASRRGTP